MEDFKIKLENVRLHNKINQYKKKEEKLKGKVYKSMKEYSIKITKIQEENEKLKLNNKELKNEIKELKKVSEKYYNMPKIVRKIFSERKKV